MAVVGTFICMATIDEASKRAMHTAVFILTALLAATGATRYPNHWLHFYKILSEHRVYDWVIISDLQILESSLRLVLLACLWDGYWNSLQQEDLYAGPGKLILVCLKGNVLVLNTWFYQISPDLCTGNRILV